MVKTIKDIVPNIQMDVILQLYFKNNYDEFATITEAVKDGKSLVFHSRGLLFIFISLYSSLYLYVIILESFSELERNLFETGLREFGKNFVKIQKLVNIFKYYSIL